MVKNQEKGIDFSHAPVYDCVPFIPRRTTMSVRAIVIGAGWASEGHTVALRDAGVDVVALCGRTPEPTHRRAAQLGIAEVRLDWRTALDELQPDIVSIATPAAPHREMAEHAARRGCHIVCDKPLAANTADARAMLAAVEAAGVKHGYAATGRYAPAILQTRLLLAQDAVGPVREIESYIHANLPAPGFPYSWVCLLDQGGGLLNNIFTHKLAQVLYATQGTVVAAAGETRLMGDRAPVAPAVHDFRELWGQLASWDPAQATEWRPIDADSAYTVTLQLRLPGGQIANALFRGSALGTAPRPEFLAIHGDAGSLSMTSSHGEDDSIQRHMAGQQGWTEVPIAPEITASLPQAPDLVQRCWNHFFREFVADVRDGIYCGYPTFADGCTAVTIMDIARTGYEWKAVSR
jgi:predicted dehydrogenase